MPYDNSYKTLYEIYPAKLAYLIAYLYENDVSCSEVQGVIEVLKTELHSESIRADFLILLKTTGHIIQVEFQLDVKPDPPVGLRMLDYCVRLYKKYRLPIVQVVILLKDTKSARELSEKYSFGRTNHEFHIIRLWEQDASMFMADPTLFPLAVLAKSDDPKKLLIDISNRTNAIEDKKLKMDLATCVQVVAGLRFEEEFIQPLFKEEIMEESVVYQRIKKQGFQQGIEQGIQKGIEKGMEKGVEKGVEKGYKQLVKQLLAKQIGPFNISLEKRIDQLTFLQVQVLAEALLRFKSLEDLKNWLNVVT